MLPCTLGGTSRMHALARVVYMCLPSLYVPSQKKMFAKRSFLLEVHVHTLSGIFIRYPL